MRSLLMAALLVPSACSVRHDASSARFTHADYTQCFIVPNGSIKPPHRKENGAAPVSDLA